MPNTLYLCPLNGLKLILFFVICFGAFESAALGQAGVSTAAAARTRALSEAGMLPASREVAVEEFINYHTHQIGRPKAGEAIALDVRWGNDQSAGSGQEAILQVGFSAALANDRRERPPLNLALVIDKSGSMSDADKMSNVKSALLTMLSQLRETDIVSIVVFDSYASVLSPARPLYDRRGVIQCIQSISPGSATNIHAGLMLGFEEARKNFRKNATNRVILLTDGIANEGVTDPASIARDSLRFNDLGIDLSTIGVGLDLNKDLLRQLAKSGRGLFHFVADGRDVQKVFLTELQSLVAPVANDPNLEIEYGSDLDLQQLYGYEPQFRNRGASIKLDHMNQGMTQVVMMRFRINDRKTFSSRPTVRVRFSYYDVEQKKMIVKTQDVSLTLKSGPSIDPLKDHEVRKNYTIALLAQAIHDMAVACESGRYPEAESLLASAIAGAYQRYPSEEDQDINRTLAIAKQYQRALSPYARAWDPRADR
jgi:Ca-activated chloride channel homolog